jgi:cysteinyl-tRNA synthetase
VRFWLHNEFLDFRGQKMSKSTGNVCLLDDLEQQGVAPRAYRYFFLQAHYRQQQAFTDDAIEAAATGYERLVGQAAELRQAPGEADPAKLEPLRRRFRDALRDDLNAPRALAVAWEAVRHGELAPAERWALLREFDAVLGLDLERAVPRASVQESDPRVDALVARREDARRGRDFAEADRIRSELAAAGILVEDTPEGPRWRRK